jgi:hypothetical protein
MEHLTALSSLTVWTADRSTARSFGLRSRTRRSPRGGRRNHKLGGCDARCGHPVEPGEPQHRILVLAPRTNKKRDPRGAAHLVCPGRRPTDLCATALFSFQGTDASARPVSDRITDRTEGAWRQSQRQIDYHRGCRVSMRPTPVLSTVSSTVLSTGSRAAPFLAAAQSIPAARSSAACRATFSEIDCPWVSSNR